MNLYPPDNFRPSGLDSWACSRYIHLALAIPLPERSRNPNGSSGRGISLGARKKPPTKDPMGCLCHIFRGSRC